jgi:hypothetical protein
MLRLFFNFLLRRKYIVFCLNYHLWGHVNKFYSIFFIFSIPLILSANTLGPTTQVPLPTGITSVQSGVFSSYNSTNHQFLLTWADNIYSLNLIIYNADGTVAVPASQLFAGATQVSGDPASCYNPHLNQYILTWNDTVSSSPAFAIIDHLGNVITNITSLGGSSAASSVYSCYNSQDQVFFITWVSGGEPGFAIVNATNGNLEHAATGIALPTGVVATSNDAFCSYNSQNNEYYVTWLARNGSFMNPSYPYFAILDGFTERTPSTLLSTAVRAATLSVSCCCYNPSLNQYLVTWVNSANQEVIIAICDKDGNILYNGPIALSDFLCFASPAYISYNSLNRQYILSIRSNTNTTNLAVLSSDGTEVVSNTLIPNISTTTNSSVYSSYDSHTNLSLISWLGLDNQGYFAFYQFPFTPPKSVRNNASSSTFFSPIYPNRPGKLL